MAKAIRQINGSYFSGKSYLALNWCGSFVAKAIRHDCTIRMTVNENGVESVLETRSDEKGWYAFTAIDHAATFISFHTRL